VKTRIKFFTIIALIAIIALAVFACDNGNDTPQTFTVRFNANGGTPQPPEQTVTQGGTVTAPPAMTKADSAFGAWYKESAFTAQWNFAVDTVTAGITLHAKWNCACNPKDHLDVGETCNCNTAPCGCTLHEYGKLGEVIPIYKMANVTDEQATTAAANITSAYGKLSSGSKTSVDNVLTEVRILLDKEYTWDGHILGARFDSAEEVILGGFQAIASGTLPNAE
jgi:hypothetical protein